MALLLDFFGNEAILNEMQIDVDDYVVQVTTRFEGVHILPFDCVVIVVEGPLAGNSDQTAIDSLVISSLPSNQLLLILLLPIIKLTLY